MYSNPSRHLQEFGGCICELIAQHGIDILLSMTEITTLTLARDARVWSTGVTWPFGSAEVIANAPNKAYVLELARQTGIPIPEMVALLRARDLSLHLDTLRFPIVIKSVRSQVRTQNGCLGTSVSYASDAQSLQQQMEALP